MQPCFSLGATKLESSHRLRYSQSASLVQELEYCQGIEACHNGQGDGDPIGNLSVKVGFCVRVPQLEAAFGSHVMF